MESTRPYDMYNAAYVQALFDRYQQNPASVDEQWRAYFANGASALFGGNGAVAAPPEPATSAMPSNAALRTAMAAAELVDAYRLHGHRAAHLDPLGSAPHGHPSLDPAFHGIAEADLETIPSALLDLAHVGPTMADVLAWLRATYTGSVGYEYEFLEDPESREWLRERIEGGQVLQPIENDAAQRLLARLTEVEAFEQFLHRAYLGQKRFSLEGTDMMVPVLDEAIRIAASQGAHDVVIGMAHRGRLNVLAQVVGMAIDKILAKFEGRHDTGPGTGDVKYHLGAQGRFETDAGTVDVVLAPNPSHLEFVNAVVVGMSRAMQSDLTASKLERDESAVVPVLIHGDAAFSGQGVVPETLNLARLNGYRTGGTLHIIANNQVGFTTDPREARSTDYASDVARGFDIPIFHVNADDPNACIGVVRLAMQYRAAFKSDVVIDLIGYRKYGHNEGDEPAYTQPVMYRRIAEQPTVRELWARTLGERNVIAAGEAERLWQQKYDALVQAQEAVKGKQPAAEHDAELEETSAEDPVDTAVPADRIAAIDRQLHTWPDGFQLNPKLARQLEKRARAVPDAGSLDWAHAEALAFGSLLTEGVPVRLSGQDSERGTFSQRHLVLHDTNTNEQYAPVGNLSAAKAPFEVHNSPLSELAVMGFEYGFSVVADHALVLWEAQFGDFVNGAQVVIDQFIAAGREKWGQESRLVLLLPHGYEGQGPEHSSARLERFLQLGGEGNLRVANCSTPAQYFHLLRRQALIGDRRPLVVMTPKSLLRHPKATSPVSELSDSSFRFVIDDEKAARHRASIERIALCSGKIYYDLLAWREEHADERVALVRVEQLYPLPAASLRAVIDAYDRKADIVWVQEEPENMGAWRFIAPSLRDVAGREVAYVGRPERASPAEGFASMHEAMQKRIVEATFAIAARSGRKRK